MPDLTPFSGLEADKLLENRLRGQGNLRKVSCGPVSARKRAEKRSLACFRKLQEQTARFLEHLIPKEVINGHKRA